jgi:hypothetical protein
MLRVMNALMSQLFVLILKFLLGIGLPVHDVLQVGLRCLQLVNTCFKLCRQLNTMSDYNKVPQLVLNGFGGQRTFVLLAQRLVLLDHVAALCLHLLHLVVVLGEGTIKLGLRRAECSLALSSSFSKASARSTVSPYP